MELHNLKPAKGATHKGKRIARGEGSGHGGTATKGHKGMKARAGARSHKSFEGGQTPLQRRLPKFGFRNINRIDYQEINLDLLHKYVEKYSTKEFSPEILSKLKLFNTKAKLKILGRGEAAPGLKIKIHACTASAKAKIEAAGGTIEII